MATYWATIRVEFEATDNSEARDEAHKMYATLTSPNTVVSSELTVEDGDGEEA